MGPLGFSNARPGSWIQKQLEADFNIGFEPHFIDPVAYAKTRPLLFIAGEVPDVFWDGDPLGVRSKARHGFVMELPYEVIRKHAPNYVAYINAHAPEAWMYSHWNGRNWGLPSVIPSGIVPSLTLWRLDWLEKVGISKVPETLEEAHEAFKRFTFNDPDGNGKNDTYALSPAISHWSYFFTEFFTAKGVLPFDMQEIDGVITWGGIRPEAKEVLALLRQWYAEGLINPDFVLAKPGMSEQSFLDGKIGYIAMQSYAGALDPENASSLSGQLRQLDPGSRVAPAAPFKGSDGQRRSRVWGGAGHVLQFSSKLENEPQKVIRILRMLDTLASNPERALEAIMGRRGTHWEKSEERGVTLLPPYLEQKSAAPQMLRRDQYDKFGFFMICGLPLDTVASLRSAAQRTIAETYTRPEWGIANVLGKTDVLESSSDTLGDLRQLQQKYYIDIIRGTRPLDAFETFVQLWSERGGSAILDEARLFLESRQRIYTLLGVDATASPVNSVQSSPLPAP